MILKVIASNSRGNAYVVDNGQDQLILECGVKMRDIKVALDFDFKRVMGCLISHEHGDHAKSVNEVINSGVSIFASKGTLKALKLVDDGNSQATGRVQIVTALKPFMLGTYQVFAFQVDHDAAEPFGYVIYDTISNQRLLFVTDTYMMRYTFKNIEHYLIECNYDDETLEMRRNSGELDQSLYKRIKESHMGLETLITAIQAHKTKPSTITLCHLSDSNINEKRAIYRIHSSLGLLPNIASEGITIELS